MKKQILYFIAGIFLTTSMMFFWGFKSKSEEPGNYAVVSYHLSNGKTTIAYDNGNTEEKKYSIKNEAEGMVQILHDMEASGYKLIESHPNVPGNAAYFSCVFIFKKK
jgi:hypothetical protein